MITFTPKQCPPLCVLIIYRKNTAIGPIFEHEIFNNGDSS